jgi:twitching motility protein PilJ
LIASDSSFRGFLDSPTNSTLQVIVQETLFEEMKLRKVEYVTVVGTDAKILAGANANRTGEVFDPSGAVTDVLTNNRRIIVTTVISNAEFRKEGALRWL